MRSFSAEIQPSRREKHPSARAFWPVTRATEAARRAGVGGWMGNHADGEAKPASSWALIGDCTGNVAHAKALSARASRDVSRGKLVVGGNLPVEAAGDQIFSVTHFPFCFCIG